MWPSSIVTVKIRSPGYLLTQPFLIRTSSLILRQDPRIKQASIQGTELHRSHKDPTDPQDVISIKFFDEDGKRVGTGHVHEDGTSKFRYKQKPLAESASSGFE